MTLANDLKPTLYDIRAIPGELGLRPHSVLLLLTDWSGGTPGEGTETTTTMAILESGQNPKVRWLNDEELALTSLGRGAVRVGPITSDHGAVARLANLRADSLAVGGTQYLVITGPKHPNGAKYVVTDLNPERAMHYMIEAKPVEQMEEVAP